MTVLSIFVTSEGSAPMHAVDRVKAHAGLGLEGDRYHGGTGSFSKKKNKPRQVTLIEAEAIEAVNRDYEVEIAPSETRRNIVVRGVALNHLVGREFTVGSARLRGYELCEPCGHLENLTRPGVKDAFVHRGGLRCEVIADGEIACGDAVRAA